MISYQKFDEILSKLKFMQETANEEISECFDSQEENIFIRKNNFPLINNDEERD